MPCKSSAAAAYIRGFEVERLYRDAKITQIYEAPTRSALHHRPRAAGERRAGLISGPA